MYIDVRVRLGPSGWVFPLPPRQIRVRGRREAAAARGLEAQRIGRLDQGAVHPDEQGKAEEEGQAGVPVRRRQRRNAKSGGRQARHPYPLSLLEATGIGCERGHCRYANAATGKRVVSLAAVAGSSTGRTPDFGSGGWRFEPSPAS